MKQIECPHCHNYKVFNEGARYWKTAFLLFAFGIPLLLLFGFGLIMWLAAVYATVRASMSHGQFCCLQCGWRGKLSTI